VGLVYDPRGLPGVTTARPRVVGVLQLPLSKKRPAISRLIEPPSGTWTKSGPRPWMKSPLYKTDSEGALINLCQ
jgi:hypothetical protein